MGRTIGILLAVSLAANVFLGGFIAGRIAGPSLPGFDRHAGRDGPSRTAAPEFDDLSPAAREKLRALFVKNRREIAKTFREARALRDEFVAVVTAETFDRAAAEAAAAKIEAFEGTRRAAMPRLVVEAMDGLPAEDRRALAALVERRMLDEMKGPGKRRRGHRGEPPPDNGSGTEQ